MSRNGEEDSNPFHVSANLPAIRNMTKESWVRREDFRDKLEPLTKFIEDFYNDNLQSADELEAKKQFAKQLKQIVSFHTHWSCNVVITGSTMTGLGAPNSDADMCLMVKIAQPENIETPRTLTDREQKIAILQIVRLIIFKEKYEPLEQDELKVDKLTYVDASIPLLKIKTVNGLEVDLSVSLSEFVSSLQNTYLIKAFTAVDSRFARLSIFIKKWASRTGVKYPTRPYRRFNSYAVVMLFVHFLQCGVSPPVLPLLQATFSGYFAIDEHNFPRTLDFDCPLPGELPEHEKNDSTLGELFTQFLLYYRDFDFENYSPNLREGKVSIRRSKRHAVAIIDPIDEHNPGRTVEIIEPIREAFSNALQFIKSMVVEGRQLTSFDDLGPFVTFRQDVQH